MILTRKTSDLGVIKAELAPAKEVQLPNSLIFDNWNDLDARSGISLRNGAYAARSAKLDAVLLVNFNEQLKVFGKSFLAVVGGIWIAEQVHPQYGNQIERLFASIEERKAVIHVKEPVVLIARYGAGTWGHWLGELLPKAVIVEQAFPGVFRYLLPPAVLQEPEGTVWGRIRETLRAYGIGPERWFGLKNTSDYTFSNCACVTPVWSDFAIHPDIVASMQANIMPHPVKVTDESRRVAFLRTETKTRKIENLDQTAAFLRERDFRFLELANLPFVEQVEVFKNAKLIVSVLGSSLTGLLYAKERTAVVSLAPVNFGDRFFYALIQSHKGFYADLRGPIVKPAEIAHWASFNVDLVALNDALQLM